MNIAIGIKKTVGNDCKDHEKWAQYIRREIMKQYKPTRKKRVILKNNQI